MNIVWLIDIAEQSGIETLYPSLHFIWIFGDYLAIV